MPFVVGQDVADFLGRGDDSAVVALAQEHVTLVTAFVKGYTRGQGFDALTDEPADDIAAVITTATARLVVNPAQLEREAADGYTAVGSFNGFSLVELAILHGYRRRGA